MLPRLREAETTTTVLADGFSCRTQIHELDSGGREGIHLAELLARAQRGAVGHSQDLEKGDRPQPEPTWVGVAIVAVLAAAGVAAGSRLLRR